MSNNRYLDACKALAQGQVIAHPTETVFGLAADPFNPAALERLLFIKGQGPGEDSGEDSGEGQGRSKSKGFIVLIPDQTWVERLALPPSPVVRKLMDHFWPGPLTLILPARPHVPDLVVGSHQSIAIRHSSSALVAALMQHWQKPLVSTSANRSGSVPLLSALQVRQQWGSELAQVLEVAHVRENNPPADVPPSTLLHIQANRGRLLRLGTVSKQQLQAVCPEMVFDERLSG